MQEAMGRRSGEVSRGAERWGPLGVCGSAAELPVTRGRMRGGEPPQAPGSPRSETRRVAEPEPLLARLAGCLRGELPRAPSDARAGLQP